MSAESQGHCWDLPAGVAVRLKFFRGVRSSVIEQNFWKSNLWAGAAI